jgi:UDP-N-acetylglucosamine--N-acetylmuramyl-(pentapeptide) pyrophosphoryl-undecaprenol N-acetylglucosamine transferase
MIPQPELTPERLAEVLGGLARERLLAMAVAARKVAKSDACDRVADACIALMRTR